VASLYYNEDEEDELNSQQANKAAEEESKNDSKVGEMPLIMITEEEKHKKVKAVHKAVSFISKTSMSLFHIYRAMANEHSMPLITNH